VRFKEYLLEMPVVTEPIPTPKGNTIEPFDAALEDNNIYSKAKVKKLTMDMMKRNNKFPLYSEKENSVFIHDTKTNKSYYAKSQEEKEMVEILLNSMWRHSIGRGKDDVLTNNLENVNGVNWKLPHFIFSKRKISK
jgi:hypothetical protein